MLDLVTDLVLFGLSEEESSELKELKRLYPNIKTDNILEMTGYALDTKNIEIEPMPVYLKTKILVDAKNFLKEEKSSNTMPSQAQPQEAISQNVSEELQKTFEFNPKRPLLQWIGWAFAGIACIALAFSMSANLQKTVIRIEPPKVLSVNEQYNNFLASARDLKKTNWTNPTNNQETLGEIVWSEADQKGFMRLQKMPVNDPTKETYQLWIFDEKQDEKTPIDGGVFDIGNNGEVLIPIDAKLNFQKPKLFAITVEKPGGVVVSKREKLVAIAKVSV